ncbi:hypothetical protein ES705_27735 [subsurface metagenome]
MNYHGVWIIAEADQGKIRDVSFELLTRGRTPPLEVVYNISKKINSKAMPLKAFWLGKSHLLCRWSFTAKRKPPALEVVCYPGKGKAKREK